MTKRDILSIALKILGVYSIMLAIVYFLSIFFTLTATLSQASVITNKAIRVWQIVFAIAQPISMLTFACVLIRWSDEFAVKLIKSDSALAPSSIDAKVIFVVSIKIIGTIQLVESVPIIIKPLISFLRVSQVSTHTLFNNLFSYEGINMIGGIVRLLIGIYLISNGRHLVKLAFKEQIE